MGSFFAEMGYGSRPTQVTYQNRRNSAFSLAESEEYPLELFIQENELIHICGISLSLTEKTAATAQLLAEKAHAAGRTVCFDFNFRPSLNDAPGQRELMKERYLSILPYSDIVFGSVRDLVELLQFDSQPESEAEGTALIQRFMAAYDLSWFVGTKRGHDGQQGTLTGMIYTPTETFTSKTHQLKALDRIGAGDAYAAGILLGFAHGWEEQQTVEFAAANGVLAHTIQGDVPLTTMKMVQHYQQHPDVDLLR